MAFVTYQLFQVRQEKRDFAKAEQKIDSLAQQIEQTIGKPDQTEDSKSCRYSSLKYSRGTLSCSIKTFMLFEKKDFKTANNLLAKISPLINTPIKNQTLNITDRFLEIADGLGNQVLYQSFAPINNITCTIEYVFPGDIYFENPIKQIEGENLLLVLQCWGPAKYEYYPVQ
jgi:hypothetical protein